MTTLLTKRAVLGACGGIFLLGLTILERLDVALAAMHRAGDVSGGATRLATPTALWSPRPVHELVRAWRDWDADRLADRLAGQIMGPRPLVGWYAVADTLLVTLPLTLLLVGLAARTRVLIEQRFASQLQGDQPAGPVGVHARALCQAARLAYVAAWIYGASDLVENALLTVVTRPATPAALIRLLGAVSGLKVVAMVVAVLPLACLMIARRVLPAPGDESSEPGGAGARTSTSIWRHLVILRAPATAALVVTAVFLALRGDLGLQLDDVVMRWVEQPGAAVAAAVAALGTAWLMVLAGQTCVDAYRTLPTSAQTPLPRLRLLALGGLGLLMVSGGLLVALWLGHSVGYMLVTPGGALLLYAALSWPEYVRRLTPLPQPAATTPDGYIWLIWALATVPIFALALVTIRAAVTLAVTREIGVWVLVAIALALIAAAVLLVWRRYSLRPRSATGRRALWTALVVLVALLSGYAAVAPLSAGGYLGAVGLLFLLAAALVLALTGMYLLGDRWAPRGALALLGLRRVPVITLVVVWYAATSLIDHTGHYHDVRLGAPLPGTYRPVSVDEALQTWLNNQSGPIVNGKRHIPMLFMATAGGGIRSAYWTAVVLDCLFSAQPAEAECQHDQLDRSAVFAASGISGGSLGLVMDRAVQGGKTTAIDALARDFLSPDVAAMAFRDLPNGLLRLEPRGQDRAAIMERSWESAVSGLRDGLFASSRTADGAPRLPLLLLNSATVDDGCRLNVSALAAATATPAGPKLPAGAEGCLSLAPFEPGRDIGDAADARALAGSKDIYDLSCRAEREPPDRGASTARQPVRYDLPISAAAHLSARFPYISPTGALTGCAWPQRRTVALDGGLLEASAVSPLVELWARLSGLVHDINDQADSGYCIEPRLVMLDNGYAAAASSENTSRPQELVAPASGVSLFAQSWGARAEQAAALAFDHVFGANACRGTTQVEPPQRVVSRIAHIVPTARPGPQAPLGWSLSQYARRDLAAQLRSPVNLCQVALIRSWFHDTAPADSARCLTGFAERSANGTATTDTIAMINDIDLHLIGQSGVTVQVDAAAALGPRATTTDASGRFVVILRSGQPTNLSVTWGDATLSVALPAGAYPVDTGLSFLVGGDGVPTG